MHLTIGGSIMKKILVSGNVNLETNLKIERFPLEYSPVRYATNAIQTNVGGVAYNVAKALATLGDDASLVAMLGNDLEAQKIKKTLAEDRIDTSKVKHVLSATPVSIVMHDEFFGQRAIFTDTKDLQEAQYDFSDFDFGMLNAVVACNVNFNRELLHKAREANVLIATDVHVLDNPDDYYNREFMKYADILFFSGEKIWKNRKDFIRAMRNRYSASIMVIGRGSAGAEIYIRGEDTVYRMKAVPNENVVNTLGAGDALFSSFLHFNLNGCSPLEALRRAQIFASHKISFNGASNGFMTEEEVDVVANATYDEVMIIDAYKL